MCRLGLKPGRLLSLASWVRPQGLATTVGARNSLSPLGGRGLGTLNSEPGPGADGASGPQPQTEAAGRGTGVRHTYLLGSPRSASAAPSVEEEQPVFPRAAVGREGWAHVQLCQP